jgi:hypothetical protein
MKGLWYYLTRNKERTVFEVWVSVAGQEGSTLVSTCNKRGDANLIRKLLQDHAGNKPSGNLEETLAQVNESNEAIHQFQNNKGKVENGSTSNDKQSR